MPQWMTAPQGSPEWLAQRVGLLTASRVANALATTKTGESEKRKSLKLELIGERLSKVAEDIFVNYAMRRGSELEPVAREVYRQRTGNEVTEVGLCLHDDIEWFGASLDGIVDGFTGGGIIEIKCPMSTAKHVETLISQEIPEAHKTQIMAQLIVSDRVWADYVSYDDRMPEGYDLCVIRYEPSEAERCTMINKVITFLDETNEMYEALKWRISK
jgi:putative phage-type endonuclease